MKSIQQDDFIQSITDALQFISYYHPIDYIQALGRAYEKEQSNAAKDAMAQIIVNSRMCAQGHRPLCQDTGIVVVFLEIGMDIRWNTNMDIEAMVNQGVHNAYTHPDNILRASVLSDPAGERKNTRDNTPAVIHTRMVAGDTISVKIAAKGGGSENKARFATLNPNSDIVQWVLEQVKTMGAGWCPPGILGIGIGGTPEKALLMAKESLMQVIDIDILQQRGAKNTIEALRLELYEKINELGIGAQGLGGLTTVLDVKIQDYPVHAASLPVAIIPNCSATRHIHFILDGSGAATFTPPRLEDYPKVTWVASKQAKRINLNNLDREQIQTWKAGEQLLLNGKLLTGRDAGHKRIQDTLAEGKPLPEGIALQNSFIYYVGPVDPVKEEIVGPAGPTTATRMDKYTDTMLAAGLLGMIGKAERGAATINSIREYKAVYLIAVGGAAYLISKAIAKARIVAYPELGMEAIYEFEVIDMPVTVAVDSNGHSIHQSGPEQWQVIQKK